MKLIDPIYGEYEITEPVLIEVLSNPIFLRLKGILQYGIPDDFNPVRNFTRYDHSIGVFLLLRRFGASLKEQLAGLLHDVSHPAFSHTIDYIFGDAKQQSFQDERHLSFVETHLSDLLEKHGFSVDEVADYDSLSLLEQPSGLLCADRIDACLQEVLFAFGVEKINELISLLSVHNGLFVLESRDAARIFADTFMYCRNNWEFNPKLLSRLNIFARLLKYCLSLGVITKDDFDLDDASVMKKILSSSDDSVKRGVAVLHSDSFVFPGDQLCFTKFRFIDPWFLDGSSVKKLSDVDTEFSEYLRTLGTKVDAGFSFGFSGVVPDYLRNA